MGSQEGTFDTKLHEAVRNGEIKEVLDALKQGYDPNLIGLFQWNPMHEAADNGDDNILKLLIQKKGDPNKPDYIQGRTPMHYATERGHIECLKLLIDCGGRYDFKDEMGKDCLDLCTPASRKMLERLKVRDLMLHPVCDQPEINPVLLSSKSTDEYSNKSELDSDTSSISSTQEKQPVIGYLHVSVEYHSNKQTLKVRIWQLSDILLPPPHTSGIHSIYVKSFLLPDKKKETKRKTEDIRVDKSEAHVQWKRKSSGQHVFMPSTFKFKRALEYDKINSDMVKDRTLQIEVAITQKYSHRSFLIGMLSISLRKAVKKVVREKIALIPCMNYTIPSNMKVYCASELDITSNKVFYSTPNVKINIQENLDDSSEKAVSDPDLQRNTYSPSVEVDMNRNIPKVPRLYLDDGPLDESGYSSEFHMSMPSELDSPDSDKAIIKSSCVNETQSTVISLEDDRSGEVSEVLGKAKDSSASQATRAVTKISNGIEITDLDEEELVSISVVSDTEEKSDISVTIKADGAGSSRPETPTWDYYDIPIDIVAVDNELPPSPWIEGAAPVLLPMDTNLSINQSKDIDAGNEGGITKPLEKVRKKSKKKQALPVPGKAIPLVPEIIVVNTDEPSYKSKTGQYSETKITMSDGDSQALPEQIHVDRPSVNMDHVVEMKYVQSVKDVNTSDQSYNLLKGKSNVNYFGEAKALCVIEPKETSESVSLDTTKQSLPVARPRTRKIKKIREGGTRTGMVMQNVKPVQTNEGNSRLVTDACTRNSGKTGIAYNTPSENKQNHSRDNFTTELSEVELMKKGNSSTNSSSVIVDIEKLSFAHSDSHIVELDDDISITELSDNSNLFSHSSVISSASVDMESGLESYKLPVRVSPTKYMIPMQVYMDDDTSCDESLSTDRSERSFTIYNVPKSSSEV